MKTLSNYIKANKLPLISLSEKLVVFHPQIDEKLIVNKEYKVNEQCPFKEGTDFFVISIFSSPSLTILDKDMNIEKYKVYKAVNIGNDNLAKKSGDIEEDMKLYKSESLYYYVSCSTQHGICTIKTKHSNIIFINSDYIDNMKKLIDFIIDKTNSHKPIRLRKIFEILNISNPFNKNDIDERWNLYYDQDELDDLKKIKEAI